MVSVGQDAQSGLSDEPIADREVQEAVKKWYKASRLTAGARKVIKDHDDAKKNVRDLMPGFDDGQRHRFTFIDENEDEPVQYVVATRPGPEPKDIAFTRTSRARLRIDQVEAPRE